MRCPNCGMEIEDGSPFCIHCGRNIEGKGRRRKLRFVLMDVEDDRRFKHLMTAVILVVVLLAAATVILTQWYPHEETATVGDGPSENAIVIDNSNYIEVGGALSDGTMTAELDRSLMYVVFTLSDEASSGYDVFDWILRNDLTNQSQYVTKTEPIATWPGPTVGIYTLSVECTDRSTGNTAVYTGTITYFGNSHIQYSFDHGGTMYSLYVDVPLNEYIRYSGAASEALRSTESVEEASAFMVTGGAVDSLAERLLEEYISVNGTPQNNSTDFAQFVLDFVQQCMTERPDVYVHSVDEYWAYPAETLFLGMGDSKDLAVLTASLLTASGYMAGIAVIGDHAVALVSLNYRGPGDIPLGYHYVRVYVDNILYHLCETTERLEIGCVSNAYGYSGGTFTYYGNPAEGGATIASG